MRLGLNPYGLTYAVGLQGAGTARANPAPIGMQGFISLASELGARCIELHDGWLVGLPDADLARLGDELHGDGVTPIVSSGLSQQAGETLEAPVRCAQRLRAPLVRLGLSPVLEGARAKWGARWAEMAGHARTTLMREAPRAQDAGVAIAIENHQDFGSEELVEMAEAAGPAAGIVFDTGNPFAVGEDPVAFARRAAHRIRHVHLKDYRAQFTDEGYRLVRCAIGDGAVPFAEIAQVLSDIGTGHLAFGTRMPADARSGRAPSAERRVPQGSLTASIEPGALDARHIRLFTADWWRGYPSRDARELGKAIGRLRSTRIRDDEPFQTPWERGAPWMEIVEYEIDQVRRSFENVNRWVQRS